MLELRCPACGRANAVAPRVDLDRVRCAACAAGLERESLVRYAVAGAGRSWGPQEHYDLVLRAARGTLAPDMLLAEEGGPWFRASERPDLFRAAGAPAAAVHPGRHAPASRRARKDVPSSVAVMAGLLTFGGGVLALLGFVVFLVAAANGAGGAGFAIFLVLSLLAALPVALAGGLRRGSATARGVVLFLAGCAGLVLLLGGGRGASAPLLLVGAILIALPFLLLLDVEARAFFAGKGRRDPGR